MSIGLYQHNKEAYEKAIKMLAEKGKAAIIHPTGTGKSFIGFQLCHDHPDKRICWLSPSEYIFQTQLENLAAEGQKGEFNNILFFSYARLMMMRVSEIQEIAPDFIILDEFHRCGAQMWGQGVLTLLNQYPEVPVLGLSATNIRFLDNRRDMAEELFDGNIASQMSLGEAIVRGILQPPKYVISMIFYEQDLEKYEKRAASAKNEKLRKQAEKYLQELRRALENAQGLDLIFQKHITEKNGKYILFCSNKEHADEMMSHVKEWFGGIDSEAHVYCVYSKDPSTSKAFEDFKADESQHLKLLFCIDMLNEGVHVEDISGVVLFRPTVSPIVYKQQIGRVMSASGKKNPIIIDVVNNISNLYSIGAIEEEMAEAVEYFCWTGKTKHIVNDSFTVIDEVQDCKKLFDKLENVLSASWEWMYEEAKKYYLENGDLSVASAYVTETGYHLGNWLVTQRGIYQGRKVGNLSPEQIRLLDKIGMNWDYKKEQNWETMFLCASQYYEEHKDLDIPANFVTENGQALGWWYRRNIANYRNGTLSKERRVKLESIGIKQESVKERNWRKYYEAAASYKEETGNLNIPAEYVTEDGLTLGTWISSQRYSYSLGKLSQEKTKQLEIIGMEWQRFDAKWNLAFSYLETYAKNCNTTKVPTAYITSDGFKLGTWVATQRVRHRQGKLADWKIEKLESIDFCFSARE